MRPPCLPRCLWHRAWHHRVSPHQRKRTAIEDDHTPWWAMRKSWCLDPMLHNFPIKLPRRIPSALLCFTSKQGPCSPRICLPRMQATPPSPFPAPTLDHILVCKPGLWSTMRGRKPTRISRNTIVSLLDWPWTICADFREIIVPWLAHVGLLSP
jgi:hypothetical protein